MLYDFQVNIILSFILYNPSTCCVNRVLLLSKQFPTIVVDNSQEENPILSRFSNIYYVKPNRNIGIAKAMLLILDHSRRNNFQYFLYFDQDTVINDTTIRDAYQHICSNSAALRNHVQICFKKQDSRIYGVRDVRFAISSGSAFDVNNLAKLGGHNKTYFVDCVDYELNVRARLNGMKVAVVECLNYFDHSAEQPDIKIQILNLCILGRRYSKQRLYDSFHSHLRLISYSIKNIHIIDSILLIKSLLTYLLIQLLAIAFVSDSSK